ncbi:MAG: NYN domain-containing protein [Egicoccus sp.]
MPDDPDAGQVPPPPTAAALADLPTDAWAALLPTVRAALNDVDEAEATAAIRRLRAAPTGRLAGGRVRREVCAVFAEGGPAWAALYRRLMADDDARMMAEAMRGGTLPTPEPAPPPSPTPRPAPAVDVDRLRSRLREARDERDALRRRLDGAESRAKRAVEAADLAEAEIAELRAELEALHTRLADAEAERERAVARERRRAESGQAKLREELAAMRRAEEERRIAERREQERRRAAEVEAAQDRREQRREQERRSRPPRLVPGRPSRFPDRVMPGSPAAVDMLLHHGRLVLVDGYNLTRQHRDHLDLETQRGWLVQLLATAALQRRVRPVAVFDGERASVARPVLAGREVEVRFTPEGITADDEIVLAVEATDEPVVVVTDDRELQARVRVSGADVVGTTEFLGALR